MKKVKYCSSHDSVKVDFSQPFCRVGKVVELTDMPFVKCDFIELTEDGQCDLIIDYCFAHEAIRYKSQDHCRMQESRRISGECTFYTLANEG